MVENGQAAPGFSLNSHDGQQVSLGQFKGKPVVVTFFPTAFTGG